MKGIKSGRFEEEKNEAECLEVTIQILPDGKVRFADDEVYIVHHDMIFGALSNLLSWIQAQRNAEAIDAMQVQNDGA